MSFENLPADWPEKSLSDPRLAIGVVDLFLKLSDRDRSSALLLLCDSDGRALQPLIINDIPWQTVASRRKGLFNVLRHLDIPAVVMAVSATEAIEHDVVERWRRTAVIELQKCGVELLGFYSADLHGVWDPIAPAA